MRRNDGSDNMWVKVDRKHVDAKLGQVASDVHTMQKALQIARYKGWCQRKARQRSEEIT